MMPVTYAEKHNWKCKDCRMRKGCIPYSRAMHTFSDRITIAITNCLDYVAPILPNEVKNDG